MSEETKTVWLVTLYDCTNYPKFEWHNMRQVLGVTQDLTTAKEVVQSYIKRVLSVVQKTREPSKWHPCEDGYSYKLTFRKNATAWGFKTTRVPLLGSSTPQEEQ